MNNFTRRIRVKVSYLHFEFDDVDKAVEFADSVARHIVADKEITVEIDYQVNVVEEVEEDADEV